MVIRHGIIPPTTNLTHPDPECDLDYVPNVARRAKVTTVLSNSFGFGGHNSVLVIGQYSEA
jgi:3-oxoacyl-[acyl-carrier-protein] synthase II